MFRSSAWAGLLSLPLFLFPAGASAAPPVIDYVTVDFHYFSPNADSSLDRVHFYYSLSGGPATFRVLIRPDSTRSPTVVDTLINELRDPGPDTVVWAGYNRRGTRFPDGRYWAMAIAFNAEGSDTDSLEYLIDTVAPRDSITLPARAFVNALVHRVEGLGANTGPLKSPVESLAVAISSRGGRITVPWCEPCLTDTTRFGIDVPDSIAAHDSITVTIGMVDAAGNRISHAHLIVVDSLPPPPPALDPVPATIDRPSLVVSGTASEADSVFLRVDGVIVARLRVVAGVFKTTVSGLSLGAHTIEAESQDRALNQSAPSAPLTVTYAELLGVVVPEHFRPGDFIQVNLSQPARSVKVTVYTLHGRRVRSFESQVAGTVYEFGWDLDDDDARPVGNGPYVLRVLAESNAGAIVEKRLVTVATR